MLLKQCIVWSFQRGRAAGDKLALICRALPLIAVWKERDRGVGVVGVITQHAKVHPTLFTLPK